VWERLEGAWRRSLAAFGGRVEGALAVDDQALTSWWSRLASALKTTPVLCTSWRTGPFLGVEEGHEAVGVFDERFELGEGGA